MQSICTQGLCYDPIELTANPVGDCGSFLQEGKRIYRRGGVLEICFNILPSGFVVNVRSPCNRVSNYRQARSKVIVHTEQMDWIESQLLLEKASLDFLSDGSAADWDADGEGS